MSLVTFSSKSKRYYSRVKRSHITNKNNLNNKHRRSQRSKISRISNNQNIRQHKKKLHRGGMPTKRYVALSAIIGNHVS